MDLESSSAVNRRRLFGDFAAEQGVVTCVAACLFCLIPAYGGDEIEPVSPELDRPVDFYQDVFPILQSNCLACHSRALHEGDLILETVEALMRGGSTGPSVTPGQPDESLLYRAAARSEDVAMPPLPNAVQARALTSVELGLIRKWIEEGAVRGERQAPTGLHWQAIPETYRAVYSLRLAPDQRTLFAGRGNRLFVYDILAGREVERLTDPLLQSLQQGEVPIYGPGVAHRDFVHSIAVHPQGRLLATGGYREIKLWERQPARQLLTTTLPAELTAAASDAAGQQIAFLVDHKEVRLWNLSNGASGVVIPLTGAPATAVALVPSGDTVIVGDEAGKLIAFSSSTGNEVASRETGSAITALAVRPSSEEVLAAHADQTIRAWPIPQPESDGTKPSRELARDFGPVTSLAVLSGDDSLLASAGNEVRLWKIADGQQVFSQKLESRITSVCATSDAQIIAAAGEQRIVRLWNRKGERIADLQGNIALTRRAAEHEAAREVARQRHANAVQAVQEAQTEHKQREDGVVKAKEQLEKATKALEEAEKSQSDLQKKLEEATARLAEAPDDEGRQKEKAEAEKSTAAASEAATKASDAHVSAERALQLAEQSVETAAENVKQRQATEALLQEQEQSAERALTEAKTNSENSRHVVEQLALTAGESLLVTAGADQPVQVWGAKQGEPVETFSLGTESSPRWVMATPSGTLVTASHDGKAVVWELSPGWRLAGRLGPPGDEPLAIDRSRISDRVTALEFSPDGTLLASGGGEPSRGGELLLWNLDHPGEPREIRDAHSDTVFDLQFSFDGTQLVTGGADKFVRLFDVASGTLLRSFEGHTDHVLGVALKADGSLIASCSADKTIKLWNAETGDQKRTIENYSRQVTSIDFIGISEDMVSCSGDKSVKFHHTTGQNYRTFGGNEDFVYVARATSGEGRVAAAGEDGVVRIWNGQDGKLLLQFPAPSPPGETAQR